MTSRFNRLSCAVTNAPGTSGALTVGAAVTGMRGFSAGHDGLSGTYLFKDGTAWEVRTGCVYTHSSASLSRGTLEDSSTGSAIALTSATIVTNIVSATELAGLLTAPQAAVLAGLSTAENTGIPEIPTSPLAVAGDLSALVYFRESARATGYTVTASPGGATASGATFPIAVSGLTNGTAYTFSVAATNTVGSSPASAASNSVTPTARPAGLAGVNVVSWHDASQMPVVANNTAVSSALDYSGNGYHDAQTVAGSRPLYKTAASWGGGATGKPALAYDGNDDFMLGTLTSDILGPYPTLFMVISFSALVAGSGARDMRILSNEKARYDEGFYLGTSTAAAGGGGTTCLKVITDGRTSYTTSPVVAINTPLIVSLVFGRQLFLNGVRASSATAGTGLVGQLIKRAQPFCEGSNFNGDSQQWAGARGERIWVRGPITDAKRWQVEAYLAAKYNMSAPAQQATVI